MQQSVLASLLSQQQHGLLQSLHEQQPALFVGQLQHHQQQHVGLQQPQQQAGLLPIHV
jgi:hypothetical protein